FRALPAGRPRPLAGAEDLAYAIHTSGSTGAPKGIGVQHRPALAHTGWTNELFDVGPADRLLFVNSLSFDLSVYDIFGTLASGGILQIAPEAALRDPALLSGILMAEPITTWNSAPAALQQLAPRFPLLRESPRPAAALRLVLLAGDWIPLSLPGELRSAFPQAQVFNIGGATETSVWSNGFRVDAVDPLWPSIPYGRPATNALYYLLDESGALCPIGAVGDMYIGGPDLSLGYIYEPERTAERFLPDPFAEIPGQRLYQTGDRGRYLADGNLEFLGRVDHQVKVRGYRIELGEIEVALCRHPEVRTAVVLVREDVPGDLRLVGYVVPVRSPAPAPAELRAFLQASLPEYMVPWAFVELAQLPATANGKLDRRALPAPGAPDATEPAARAYVAPRNDLERSIGAVWAEVLERPDVGVQESFFKIGGNSLLLARLQVRLREVLGRDVPFVELFKHPTIESLAESLTESRAEPQTGSSAEAAPVGSEPERVERVRARTEGRREAIRQQREERARRRQQNPLKGEGHE
ncbi:MAG TPA: non-ribosomal peptide synthetase, partial [Thermoanaerobaculia bacterium]|nr:non-ribosomal peptide synthetase [Thermoanaerobaculia bacterium]